MDMTSDGRAEIVEEIMDNLRPWTRPESEVQTVIHQIIETLQSLIPSEASLFDRGAIKNEAQEFQAAIAKVKRLLHAMNGQARWRLFADPPPKLSDDSWLWRQLGEPPPKIPEEFEETCLRTSLALDNRSFDEMVRPYVHRLRDFHEELERLLIECEQLVRNPPGPHPNADAAKINCALFAYGLVRDRSKRPPTGTAEGPFRRISELLYQAVLGKKEADLKRACDKVLRWEHYLSKRRQARARLREKLATDFSNKSGLGTDPAK